MRLPVRRLPAGAGRWTLRLRLPGWCERPGLRVNGRPARPRRRARGGYAALEREWGEGDEVTLELPMPVRRLRPTPRAVRHGPGGARPGAAGVLPRRGRRHGVDPGTWPPGRWRRGGRSRLPGLPGGHLSGGRGGAAPGRAWEGALYQDEAPHARGRGASRPCRLRAVPYFAWANQRGRCRCGCAASPSLGSGRRWRRPWECARRTRGCRTGRSVSGADVPEMSGPGAPAQWGGRRGGARRARRCARRRGPRGERGPRPPGQP